MLVRLALLALVATAAIPSKADCEQCATANLVECKAIGGSVYCVYQDGSYSRTDRIRSKS